MDMPLVAILNGPNLNLLGLREPALYGADTLADIGARCADSAATLGLRLEFRQTNAEGELIDWVQSCRGRAGGIIINPAGYTTSSVGLLDALLAFEAPIIELHLTNIHRRESFRRDSLVSLAARAVICGLGAAGYTLALQAMAGLLLGRGSKP